MKNNNQPICQIDQFGTKRWFLNGELHCLDGPALENKHRIKIWYLHGQRHRENGPAVEYDDGSTIWYHHGQLHREDGPAVEYANGEKYWHYHGKQIHCDSQEEFARLIKLRALW